MVCNLYEKQLIAFHDLALILLSTVCYFLNLKLNARVVYQSKVTSAQITLIEELCMSILVPILKREMLEYDYAS